MGNFFKSFSVIAEIAQSYEGSFDLALASVDAAAACKADLINFQVFMPDELAVPSYTYYDLYKKIEMPTERWGALISHSHTKGLRVIVNVFGFETAKALAGVGVDAYKIHAADTANVSFLEKLSGLGKPVLVSTGGSSLSEVNRAITTLTRNHSIDLGLILGFQNSPTAAADTHLARIAKMKERFGLPVGYADHIDGELPLAHLIAPLAFAAGADFVEKHINLSRLIQREDFVSALDPIEFADVVKRIQDTKEAFGLRGGDIGEGELEYREGMKKKVVTRIALAAGTVLSNEHIALLRSNDSTDLWSLDQAVGRTLKTDLPQYSVVRDVDLGPKPTEQKRVGAVLLCRNKSERLYGKPLQKLGEKTILEHLIDQLRLVSRIKEIVLAISEGPDNHAFIELADRLGLPYVVGDEIDGLSRMIQAAEFARLDTVFRVTTENPFIYYEAGNEWIERHFAQGADLTICEHLPEGAYAEVIELSALKRAHEEGGAKYRTAWVSLYISENPQKFKIQKLLPPESLKRPDIRLTVDYPEDLTVVRGVFEGLGKRMPLPLQEIVSFLDKNPALAALNKNVDASGGRIWN